jgi:hypothetical protein
VCIGACVCVHTKRAYVPPTRTQLVVPLSPSLFHVSKAFKKYGTPWVCVVWPLCPLHADRYILVSLPFSRFRGLQEVWDTLGVCGVASMPPATQGYSCSSTPGMSALRGRGWPHKGRLVLAPEASTALSLVADLASSHVCVYVYVCVHWGRGVLCVYMCTCGVCVCVRVCAPARSSFCART